MRQWLIQFASAISCLLLLTFTVRAVDEAPARQASSQGESSNPIPPSQFLEVGEVTLGKIEVPPAPVAQELMPLDAATESRIDNVMRFGDWVSPAPQIPGALPGPAQIEAQFASAPLARETLVVDGVTLSRIDADMQFGDWISAAPQSSGMTHSPYIPGASPDQVFRLVQVQPPARQPVDTGDIFESDPLAYLADINRRSIGLPSLNFEDVGIGAPGAIPGSSQIGASEQIILASSDAGALLQASSNVQTVKVQQRSPVAFNPHIRGYNVNQIYTVGDSAYWMPVREDLDSMLAKIDPTLIREMVVVPGPYGLRYGPGLSFIDVVTAKTPRYDGYEGHNRFGLSYHANGERIYGRDTVYGGNSNYGYMIGYGNRTGNDYAPGANAPISLLPSSYHNQNFFGQLGFDVSPDSDIEFRYSHLDQVRTEYAGQFFDVNALATDGFNVAYNYESPVWDRTTSFSGWYNTTDFAGDTDRKRQQNFPVIERVDAALNAALNVNDALLNGTTSGDLSSTGARTVTTWGANDNPTLALGADFRYLDQALVENYEVVDSSMPPLNLIPPFTTNLPRAEATDPGAFGELTLPTRSYWTTKIGGRIDFYNTSADARQLRTNPDSSLPGVTPGDPSTYGILDQNDVLLAFYLTNDIEVNEYTTLRIGGGHAQRAPTLRERYADGLFLAILQSGFSRVIGDPALRKERAWQIDGGIDYEDDIYRWRLHAFGSWIEDYITYQGNLVNQPLGARLLQTINTDYATLAGFEAAGEVNVTPMLSTYGSVSYVDGRDHQIDRALPQISPLQGRFGIRWHDPSDQPRWGTDFGFRIVDNQDMVGYVHAVGGGSPVLVESPTSGFTTAYLRGFYNLTENMNLVGGIENLFDKTYLEHLDIRYPNETINGTTFANTTVYSPGITPYLGVEWTR